ncbi:hypothetical protein N0V90_009424 [Kalmusia sp. IMI 367209]|nr:hypothetical protein N0V90_009424 [Kalmusia sp. IMI 367209]
MPKILPPYPIITPDYVPGMSVSVMPLDSKHALWLDDYEYYDQLGRDPLQERKIWGIEDAQERVERLQEVLEEYPKMMHRRNMLFKATIRGDEELVRCLIDAGVDIQPDIQKVLEEEKNKEEVEPDPNNPDLPEKFDKTCAPVHAAASGGHLGILKMFFESGVDIDVRGEFGDTPLICAHGRPELMHYLLDQGADATLRIYDNEEANEWHGEHAKANALERTAPHGNADIINRLLDVPGVEVTPTVVKLAPRGDLEALRLVLERGGYHPDAQDKIELLTDKQKEVIDTALPEALECGEFESMKLILSYTSIVNERGELAETLPEALHKSFVYGAYNALIGNDIPKFEYIYNLGLREHETMSLDKASYNQRFSIQHLFDEVAKAGAIESARYLIEKHSAIADGFRIPSGVLPMYEAAMYNRADFVRYLIEDCGVDIQKGNGRWAAGPTAMWIALQLKQLETISVLLEHGGPVDHVDEELHNLNGPVDAVLITGMNLRVSLRKEENISEKVKAFQDDYQNPNPPYVRITLGPEDESWIKNLVPRKPDEDLREHGDLARILNKDEEPRLKDFAEDDPRRRLPDYPSEADREEALKEDDNLLPGFRPAFRAA